MRYAKAITGAVITGLASLQAAWDGGVTGTEGIGVAIATLVALGAVWAIPNKPVAQAFPPNSGTGS